MRKDILSFFVTASAYLHHRVVKGKIHVTIEDVDYIKDLYERYFDNLGIEEAEILKREEISNLDTIEENIIPNQRKQNKHG